MSDVPAGPAPGTNPAEARAAVRDALMLFVGDPDWLDEMTDAALEAAAPHLAAATHTHACDHEYTLNVQLTHAWCQKCDRVIPMTASGGVRDMIFAQGAAAERERTLAEVRREAEVRLDMLSPDDYAPAAATLADVLLVVAGLLAAVPGQPQDTA